MIALGGHQTPSAGWTTADQGWSVAFRAVPLSMRALVATIIATIAVGGGLLTAVLIGLDTKTGAAVPRGLIIGLGGVLGLGLTAALFGVWRWKAKTCRIAFSASDISIETDGRTITLPVDQVETIIIRCDSDYARLEVMRAGARPLSYFAGLCRQPDATPGQDAIPYPPPAVLDFFKQLGFGVRLATDPREGRIIRLVRTRP